MLFKAIIEVVAFKLIVSIVLFLGLIVCWLMIGPTGMSATSTEVVLGQHLFPTHIVVGVTRCELGI
jgi:hypothetical protein